MKYIFFTILLLLSTSGIFFLFLKIKINKVEKRILNSFKQRADLIPPLFEISKPFVNKHSEIFGEIMKLRKNIFFLNSSNKKLIETIKVQESLHNELNFIFKVCNKHPELMNEGNFIYLRELVIEKSYEIGKDIELYKRFVEIYNNFINYKNYSVILLILPFGKIEEI